MLNEVIVEVAAFEVLVSCEELEELLVGVDLEVELTVAFDVEQVLVFLEADFAESEDVDAVSTE